jgi:membrane protein YdbS with pleckstrin-like domain
MKTTITLTLIVVWLAICLVLVQFHGVWFPEDNGASFFAAFAMIVACMFIGVTFIKVIKDS